MYVDLSHSALFFVAEAGFVLLLLLQERYVERPIIISKVRSREWPLITHGNNLENRKGASTGIKKRVRLEYML